MPLAQRLQATALLTGAARITVLTGAGISTDSGIPDFRGPNGLWTRDPQAARYVNFEVYRSDPSVRAESWRRRAAHPALTAQPNPAHRALVRLQTQGRLHAVLTQNIDGLHQAAGVESARVLELHGTLHQTQCLRCDQRRPIGEALTRVRAGESDPNCGACGGILKSATVFFGQPLDQDLFARAVRASQECDLFLVVGSSLRVQPVAGLVGVAARQGHPVIVLNGEPTPYDGLAQVVLREPIGSALPAMIDGS